MNKKTQYTIVCCMLAFIILSLTSFDANSQHIAPECKMEAGQNRSFPLGIHIGVAHGFDEDEGDTQVYFKFKLNL